MAINPTPIVGVPFFGVGDQVAPLPVGWSPGDVCQIGVECQGDQVLGTPAGWVKEAEVASQLVGMGDAVRCTVFSRTLQGGDSAPTITIPLGTRHMVGFSIIFPGATGVSFSDTGSTVTNDTTVSTIPVATASVAGSMVCFWTAAGDWASESPFFTGIIANGLSTVSYLQAGTTFGSDGVVGLIYGIRPTADGDDAGATAATSEEEANVSIVLSPNGVAGGGGGGSNPGWRRADPKLIKLRQRILVPF